MAPLVNFSGIASGIDSAGLIKALLDRERAARIIPIEDRIASLTDTNSALKELSTLLTTLQSAAGKFRSVNGSVLNKLAASSDETILTASASNSAQNGSYSLSVTQLAKNATYTFGSTSVTYTSSDQAISSGIGNSDPNRTVSVEIGSGSDLETINIELTNTTTLQDFVNSFNSASTKATASVVNVGTTSSPSYKVVISTNNSGLDKGQINVTVGSEITDPDGSGATDDGAFNSNTVSQATDATFSIGGVGNLTRATNSISDVIPGVTFNLKGIGSSIVSVNDDVSGTTAVIQGFVDAYNKAVAYIKENDLITQEQNGEEITNIFGSLAGTSLDDNILTALRSAISSSSISGQSVNTLADLGITTQRDGSLKLDTAVLSSAISSDPESVRTITENLGETLSSVDGTLAQFIRFNGLVDITTRANEDQISSLNKRISEVEKSLSQQEQTLIQRFSRLEALIGQLTSQQSTLTSLLPK